MSLTIAASLKDDLVHELVVPFTCPDCGTRGMELLDTQTPDAMGRSVQALLRCCREWTITVRLTPRGPEPEADRAR